MKRALYFLFAVCVAAVLGGWVAARIHTSNRMRESAEKMKLAMETEAKQPALYFAAVAREAEEAVIFYHDGQNDREVRLNDPAWISQLSTVLASGSYPQTAHGLWMSTPRIRLYRKNAQILDLMFSKEILRVYGEQKGGDYAVGETIITAIRALTEKADPNRTLPPVTPPDRR